MKIYSIQLISGTKTMRPPHKQNENYAHNVLYLMTLFSMLTISIVMATSSSTSSNPIRDPVTSSSSSSSISRNDVPRSKSLPRSHGHRRRTFMSTTVTNEFNQQRHNEHENDESNEFNLQLPPWNPSPNIDSFGYLTGFYHRLPGEWEKEYYNHHENHHHLTRDSLLQPTRNHPCYQNPDNNLQLPCRIRQVPGDGNCLFHSISMSLYYAVNGTQWDITNGSNGRESGTNYKKNRSYEDLYQHSKQLRKAAVECLSSSLVNRKIKENQQQIRHGSYPNYHHRRKYLYLQGREYLSTSELLHAAASQYGITPEEYCDSMEQDSVWGGGPEIVALCNILKRPIHVYELATMPSSTKDGTTVSNHLLTKFIPNYLYQSGSGFVLRRMACFGSPKFDKNRALHILSADSRFPDIQPGQQLAAGNHFLAVFPDENQQQELQKKNRNLFHSNNDNVDKTDPYDNADDNKRTKHEEHRKNKKQRVRGGFFMSKRIHDEDVDSDSDRDLLKYNHFNNSDILQKRTIAEELQYQHSTHSLWWMSIQWWKDIIDRVVLGH